jgi:hypothetical protein
MVEGMSRADCAGVADECLMDEQPQPGASGMLSGMLCMHTRLPVRGRKVLTAGATAEILGSCFSPVVQVLLGGGGVGSVEGVFLVKILILYMCRVRAFAAGSCAGVC